jgi:hypothetical protein
MLSLRIVRVARWIGGYGCWQNDRAGVSTRRPGHVFSSLHRCVVAVQCRGFYPLSGCGRLARASGVVDLWQASAARQRVKLQ